MSKQKIYKKIIDADGVTTTLGKYEQGIQVNRMVYISGMIGMRKSTFDELVKGGVAAETTQALNYMAAVLKKAKSDFHKVVKTTILLANMDDLEIVDKIYTEFFKPHFPARSVYQVSKLRLDARVEIEAIAITGDVEYE